MRMVKSVSIDPEAIIFCCGCVCGRVCLEETAESITQEPAHRYCNHNIGVALKRLDDLSALEVPQVDLVILAAGDYPLASSNTEARGDAIFLISVPDVGLQAAGCLVVP